MRRPVGVTFVTPITPFACTKKAIMRRLRIFVLVGLALLFGFWWNYHSANFKVNDDPTSAPNLAAAKEAAQPLLDAPEKYHADNGLYPRTLDSFDRSGLTSSSRAAWLPVFCCRMGL